MVSSRRGFLATAAMAAGAVSLELQARAAGKPAPSSGEILSLFKELQGEVGLKIHAPAADGRPEVLVSSNSDKQLFVGSAIKTFILCESLRQADSPQVVQTLKETTLALDASVWSLDSATFNPPNLSGKVSQRTALEAMIMHSDNTGTDMCIKHAVPDKVRAFIASAGLKDTRIPDSTRALFGYLGGVKDPRTITWDELQKAVSGPLVNLPLNSVETMASSADDFVSYYSRALQGAFFQHRETLAEFRRILSLGDAIWLVPMPLGVSAFSKGGSIDVPRFHAVCAPGAMLFDGRWVYFSFAYNWKAAGESDPASVGRFAAAVSEALARVKAGLSC